MKKLIAFILVLTFAFLLVGCFANQEGKRKYKLTLIDNFGLHNGTLEEYYYEGDEVKVYVKFLSGPLVGINLNGVESKHTDMKFDEETASQFYSFVMPSQDSVLYITRNTYKEHSNVDCENGKHGWKMGKVNADGTQMIYECAVCGAIKTNDITQQ